MTKIEAMEELDLLTDAAHICGNDWSYEQWAEHNSELAVLHEVIKSHTN